MKLTKLIHLIPGLLCLGWAKGSIAAPLTLERLQKVYGNIQSFEAEVVQTKTSPLLLRPIVTKVDIQQKGKILEWRAQGQSPLRVDFSQENAPQLLSEGSLPLQLPEPARHKLLRTLEAIRDLLSMDKRLEKNFQIKVSDRTLLLKPLRQDVFFQDIRIEFDAADQIEKLTFFTADDETQLVFVRLRIVR